MEIPDPPTFSSNVSQEVWEEEHAERERQRMEVAMLYGGRKNGLSPLVEESNSSQQEPESEALVGSSTRRYSNQMDNEREKQAAVTGNHISNITRKESTKDFEEELHQLDLLVQQSRSPGDVGKSVPFQPHEWKEPVSQPPPPQIRPPSESSEDEEKEEGDEEEEEEETMKTEGRHSHPSSAPYTQLPDVSVTHTEDYSQQSNLSRSSDPFAPLQSPPETSAPLLSEVLSAHSSYSESLPSKTLVIDFPETGPLPGPVTPSKSSQEHTTHTPQTHMLPGRAEKHEVPHRATPSSRIKKLDVPTEVQEVGNGIKVRAVQRTRWTPEAPDPHARSEEGEGLHEVMPEHGRRWTYGGSRDKAFAKVRAQLLASVVEKVGLVNQGSIDC